MRKLPPNLWTRNRSVLGSARVSRVGLNFADLVILKSNPLHDIKNASDIDSVMKSGVIFSAESLLTNSPSR